MSFNLHNSYTGCNALGVRLAEDRVNIDLETKSVISPMFDVMLDAGRIARLFSLTIGHQSHLQTERHAGSRMYNNSAPCPKEGRRRKPSPMTCQNEIHSQMNLKPWLALCDSHPHIFLNPETCIKGLPRLRWVYNCEFKVAQELKLNITSISGSG